MRSGRSAGGSLKEEAELSLETWIWRIEKFAARNNDHIEPCRRLLMAEQFPGDALGAIADDGAANPPRGRDPEPRVPCGIGRDEHGHVAAAHLGAAFVCLLEVGPAPDVFARPERRHAVLLTDELGRAELPR
jgi:hypothetical protein